MPRGRGKDSGETIDDGESVLMLGKGRCISSPVVPEGRLDTRGSLVMVDMGNEARRRAEEGQVGGWVYWNNIFDVHSAGQHWTLPGSSIATPGFQMTIEAVYRVDVIPQAAGRFVYTSATARGRFNEREIKLKAARPGGDPSEGCMDRADV